MADDNSDLKLGDIFKKVVSTGIGAAFMTEEAIKSKLGDLPLPKEMVGSLLQAAKGTREEVTSSIKNEVKDLLSKVDLSKELRKVLDNYEIEVNAKLNFTPKKKPNKKA